MYVKGLIKKSYGNDYRAVVIFFPDGIVPTKGHCMCPIGTSGICCHIFALLLFLKHFSSTGEKIVELTVTEQLQK